MINPSLCCLQTAAIKEDCKTHTQKQVRASRVQAGDLYSKYAAQSLVYSEPVLN